MVIYKATFPNNKCYIGKTKDISDRMEKHKYSINYNLLFILIYRIIFH